MELTRILGRSSHRHDGGFQHRARACSSYGGLRSGSRARESRACERCGNVCHQPCSCNSGQLRSRRNAVRADLRPDSLRAVDDASQLQATLETLRMFGRVGLESPKTRQTMDPATFGVLETVLKTADITETAERVRILVEITPDIFKLSGSQKKR